MFLSQDRPKPADLLQPLCDLLFSVYRSDDLKSRWLWPVCMFGHIIYGGFISGNLPSSFFPHCATSTCRAAALREDRYKEDMQEIGKRGGGHQYFSWFQKVYGIIWDPLSGSALDFGICIICTCTMELNWEAKICFLLFSTYLASCPPEEEC